ncbi:MAG: hypothetical protein UY49_C0021G0002 [Microgenomates group bacterium GW2011_GWC1_49_7]|nr:MAG: hypothetical protein UY49_C0021G0002 [Microgenomates group bacterium GW2011_GWC1_49_7]
MGVLIMVDKTFPRGTVFAGNFGEAAAFARIKVNSGEWTSEFAQQFTEQVYRRTMLEQLAGVPQPERPEELPQDIELFRGRK